MCGEWTCYCWPPVMVTMMMMYIETLYIDRALSFHRVIHHCRRTTRDVWRLVPGVSRMLGRAPDYPALSLLVSRMRNWMSRLWFWKYFSLPLNFCCAIHVTVDTFSLFFFRGRILFQNILNICKIVSMNLELNNFQNFRTSWLWLFEELIKLEISLWHRIYLFHSFWRMSEHEYMCKLLSI